MEQGGTDVRDDAEDLRARLMALEERVTSLEMLLTRQPEAELHRNLPDAVGGADQVAADTDLES